MAREHLTGEELDRMTDRVRTVRNGTGAALNSVRGMLGTSALTSMPLDVEMLVEDIRLYQIERRAMLAALRVTFDESGFCSLCQGHHPDPDDDGPRVKCPVREIR